MANPAEILRVQHERLVESADFLKWMADAIIDTTNPDNATWDDVARFTQGSDAARALLENLQSQYREYRQAVHGDR